MSGRLCARCAGKLLPVNMIANDMKACIQAKRSLFARAISRLVGNGVVGDASPVLMHWGVTSDLKQGVYVSSPYWMKKWSSANASGRNSRCSRMSASLPQARVSTLQLGIPWMLVGSRCCLLPCWLSTLLSRK